MYKVIAIMHIKIYYNLYYKNLIEITLIKLYYDVLLYLGSE